VHVAVPAQLDSQVLKVAAGYVVELPVETGALDAGGDGGPVVAITRGPSARFAPVDGSAGVALRRTGT
jgi:hypothetical protein